MGNLPKRFGIRECGQHMGGREISCEPKHFRGCAWRLLPCHGSYSKHGGAIFVADHREHLGSARRGGDGDEMLRDGTACYTHRLTTAGQMHHPPALARTAV